MAVCFGWDPLEGNPRAPGPTLWKAALGTAPIASLGGVCSIEILQVREIAGSAGRALHGLEVLD